MGKKLTMEQIAEELNISKALVSLALSNKYGVSEEMRSRIMLYAMENGYDFNRRRRATARARSVVVLISSDLMLFEAFWSKIIIGIEQGLTEHKINMNVVVTSRSHSLQELSLQIANSQPDGIIMLSQIANPAAIAELKRLNLPIVLVDSADYTDNDLDRIEVDNYFGGYNAAKYLFSLGHRNFCFIGDPTYANSFKQRLNGFRDFCDSRREAVQIRYLTDPTDDNELHCYNHDGVLSYLSLLREHVAVMCANDPIAFQVYRLCHLLQREVGRDLSILGFDDVETCLYLNPALSSVHVPKNEMGKVAAETVAQRINGSSKPFELIQLSTKIVSRQSVANFGAIVSKK